MAFLFHEQLFDSFSSEIYLHNIYGKCSFFNVFLFSWIDLWCIFIPPLNANFLKSVAYFTFKESIFNFVFKLILAHWIILIMYIPTKYSPWRPLRHLVEVMKKPNSRIIYKLDYFEFNPPASKVSREIANLIERKNPHTPVYGVKEFVCLAVCYNFYDLQKTSYISKITATLASRPVFSALLPCVPPEEMVKWVYSGYVLGWSQIFNTKKLPRLVPFAGGYEICHTNFCLYLI